MNISEITGLDISTMEEARFFYEDNKPDDAPVFSDEVLPYLRVLRAGVSWAEATDTRDALDAHVRQAGDTTKARYAEDAQTLDSGFPVVDPDDQEGLDRAFSAGAAAQMPLTKAASQVFERFLRVSRNLSLVNDTHDDKHAEFHWRYITLILAGAGYEGAKTLVEVVLADYPEAPYSASMTQGEWDTLVQDAHETCGWPTILSWAPWRSLAFAMKPRDSAQVQLKQWLKVVALFHVLKHVRLAADGVGIAVTYNHVSVYMKLKKDASSIDPQEGLRRVLEALGCPGSAATKNVYPMTQAVKWVLSTLPPRALLVRRPTADLPVSTITGPWVTLQQSTSARGFIQHGAQLFGVWRAAEGRVTKYVQPDDDLDVVGWDYDLQNPYAYIKDKDRLSRIIPARYKQVSPFEVYREHFPNLSIPTGDEAAYGILFDLPIYASLLRNYVYAFNSEFPPVFFLPSSPTHEDSTNQGKTVSAHTFARVFAPAIPVSVYRGTGSAPDERSAANEIDVHGTIMLDEWRPAPDAGAVLSHQGLQSLATGGTLQVGRVFENSGGVHLRHSICASCKTAQLPDDMVNRSFFWFLDTLTAQDRARADAWERIQSGELSLRMKLGAFAEIEEHNLHLRMQSAPLASGRLRFPAMTALIRLLCEVRGVEYTAVEEALGSMHKRFFDHCYLADDSGLTQEMATGNGFRITLSEVFYGLTPIDLEDMSVPLEAMGKAARYPSGWFSPSHALLARLQLSCEQGLPTLKDYPRVVLNSRERKTDRQIAQAFSREIKRRLPVGGHFAVSESLALAGWVLVRGADQGRSIRLTLINTRVTTVATVLHNLEQQCAPSP